MKDTASVAFSLPRDYGLGEGGLHRVTLEHGGNLALLVYIHNKEQQSVVLSAFSKERITLNLWQCLEASVSRVGANGSGVKNSFRS